ncbi:hypothetical protein [Aurantibacillus circumpalustris]|uniref:hypothetical protein n=1 Tax=Aurantibacillus circumpalustris TaxID=3036359 RepID=UPI00295AEB9D|nr:hypothetical protein [Aurantibacillus circumpalustris]
MRIFIFFIFFTSQVFAQKVNTKETDKYVDLINGFLKTNSLIKKQADSLSIYGGDLKAYYLKTKLVFIKSHHGGEFGYVDYTYYLSNDSLVFVNEKKVSLKEPITEKEYGEYERYVIFHTDKKGNVDYSKWPLGTDINNDYYFKNNSVISFQLRNFNKPVKTSENEIIEAAKTLVSRYKVHLEELK